MLLHQQIFRLLFTAAIIGFSLQGAKAQSFIKPMGNGLDAPVSCTCTDSLGNVYAVTADLYNPKYGDTLRVNRWDTATRKWSVFSKLPGYLNNYISYSTCNFLYGKFYLTGRNANSGNVDLMQYNAGTWTKITTFKIKQQFVGMNSVNFKNRLYFTGGFDSVGFQKMPGLAVFNGSAISASGLPAGMVSGESFMEIISDSLFLTSGSKIILHKSPSTWSIYRNKSNNIYSMAAKNGILYAYSSNSLCLYRNGLRIDSINPGIFIKSMKTYNDRILINGRQNIYYTLKNTNTIRPVFYHQVKDSNTISFLATGNKLYFYGSNGVVINKINYSNIIEIEPDSLHEVGYDTVVVKAFADRNSDYQFNAGDQSLQYASFTVDGGTKVTDANGYFTAYPLENQDLMVMFQGFFQFDTCYKLPFTGNLTSKCYNSPITRDTLFYPFRRTSLMNRNLILRSYGRWGARLMDSTYLYFNVFNRDCDLNISSATVTIKLDKNTYLASSKPNYTSRNGNELTYSLSNIYAYDQSRYIILNVVYPNSKYSIGQKVKHTARLTTTFTEDTLDNADSIVQKMVYSYDPNVKHSVPEGKITKDLKNVRYYIEFQNEGNDDAIRVTVVDTLNLKIPVYEFQMIGSSHPYTVSIAPGTNIVTWVFNNINLRPKSVNEPLSKGYLIFDAKLKANVKVGDSIRNKASIFFDYNKPIITNYAVISRVDPVIRVDKIEMTETKSLKAYPNPAQGYILVENSGIVVQDIAVYDLRGALVKDFRLNGGEIKSLSLEGLAKGLYVLKNNRGEHFNFVIN